MTALPVPPGPRAWLLALGAALLLHAGLLLMFHHLVQGGAADVGLRGIAVGLPPAGAAPGAPAEATVGEAQSVAPPEAAEVASASVPEVAEVPMVETAAVRPPEAFVPPTAEPLYGPVETVEPVEPPEEQEAVQAAPPVEAEVREVEPVDVEEVVMKSAMAVPPPPKAKPQPPAAEPPVAAEVTPAPEPTQTQTQTQTPTQTQTAAVLQDGPVGAKDDLIGNHGKVGTDDGAGTGTSEGQSGGGAPGAFVNYKAQLYAWLEKHKEYPRRARLRRQEGTALLQFVMDRSGRVLEYRIVESSGYELLDEEVVAMIERASPLPTPPAAMEGERFNYIVPVLFDQR